MAREKTRRIFISDIHMSSAKAYNSTKYPSWFRPERDEERLLNFLDKSVLKQSEQIKDLVLLGDIFNTWVWPAEEPPPAYADIFKANKQFLDKLEEIISASVNVFFINGNHDFDLSPAMIQEGGGPRCLDSLMGGISSDSVVCFYEKHQAASANG